MGIRKSHPHVGQTSDIGRMERGISIEPLGRGVQVVDGDTVKSGAFEGTFFGVPNLSAQDRQEAMRHLSIENGVLRYHEDPVIEEQ